MMEASPALPIRCMDSQTRIVTLNVGGRRFQTTLDTLSSQPGTFFESLMRHQSTSGEIFIDRDADCFVYIMRYLRDKRPPVIPNDLPLVDQLLREAEFYQITELIEHLAALNEQLLKEQERTQREAERQLKRKPLPPPSDPAEGTGSPIAKRTLVLCCEHAGRNLGAMLDAEEAAYPDPAPAPRRLFGGDRVFSTDEDF
eukprot:tig00001042_g6590.t1